MDDAEKHNLLHRAKVQRDLAVQQAEAEYATAIRSIEHVYKLANDDHLAATLNRRSEDLLRGLERNDADADRDGPAPRVRAIIADMGEFSTPMIVSASRARDHDNPLNAKQVSSVLNKFAKTGEVVIVKRGAGRDANVCRKAADAQRSHSRGHQALDVNDEPEDEEVRP